MLARAAEPALADLREQVVERALDLESAELEAAGSGDLLSRVGDDVRSIAESFTEVDPADRELGDRGRVHRRSACSPWTGGSGWPASVAVPFYVLGAAVVPAPLRRRTTAASGRPTAPAPRRC